MPKITKGKSNVDTRLEEEVRGMQSEADAMECRIVVKLTRIEGRCCGVDC